MAMRGSSDLTLGELVARIVPEPERTRLRFVTRSLLIGLGSLYALSIILGALILARPTLKPILGVPVLVTYLGGSLLFLGWATILIGRSAGLMVRSNCTLSGHLERQMIAEEKVEDLLVASLTLAALQKLDRRISLELKLSERLIVATTSAGALLPAATAIAGLLPGSGIRLRDTAGVGIAALLLGFTIGRLLRADFLDRLLKLRFVAGEARRRMVANAAITSSAGDL